MTQKFFIIRGLPGSGKSTLAASLDGPDEVFHHVETDQYFTDENGEYKFDGMQIGAAHEWCQQEVEFYLRQGYNVVVSNTFTRISEMQFYLDLADELGLKPMIIELKQKFGSVHGVPDAVVKKMAARWEEYVCS